MEEIIKLPSPQKDLDYPLMKALEKRRSKRKWKDEPLSDQNLSDLLWAACGITMEATKRTKCRRTAPSATNCQSVKIYVAIKKGLYLYEEARHELILILREDVIRHISTQKMMQSAPAGLIFVSDYSRMKSYLSKKDDDRKWFVAGTETGFISQNIYLYCAASGLNTVIIGLVDRHRLHNIIGLKEHERVVYTQAVGLAPDK
jgi:SagB-type dehydrogenase family enzyme